MMATREVARKATKRLRELLSLALCVEEVSEPFKEEKSWVVEVHLNSAPPPGFLPLALNGINVRPRFSS